jgi:hypothetical protein
LPKFNYSHVNIFTVLSNEYFLLSLENREVQRRVMMTC